VPSPAPSNVHVGPGPLSPQDLIADIANGFYVTEMMARASTK
jgi:PmbA protein